jgi:hypothetical protein
VTGTSRPMLAIIGKIYLANEQAAVVTRVSYWDSVLEYFDANRTSYTSELSLRGPFEAAYLNAHNHAIKDSSDAHAEMWTAADIIGLEEPPVNSADFIFVYSKKLVTARCGGKWIRHN